MSRERSSASGGKEQLGQQVLLSVSKNLSTVFPHDQALARSLESMCAHLGWRTAAFWAVDEETDVLSCVNFYSSEPCQEFEEITRSIRLKCGEGLPGRIWKDPVPTWIEDVVEDANFPRSREAMINGLHAAFGFPVTVGGKFIGVFEFFSKKISNPDKDLLAAFQFVGTELGQFFERQRIENELAHQAKLNKYAADIGTAVNHDESLSAIMESCARITVTQLDAAVTYIFVARESDGQLELVAQAGDDEQDKLVPLQRLQLKTIVETKMPYQTNDIIGDTILTDKKWARERDLLSFAGYPLMVDDKLLGVIAVISCRRMQKWALDALFVVANNLSLGIARKTSEQQLLVSEGRFRIFADNVSECLFVSAPLLTRHYYVSPAFEKIWGIPVAEVLANPFVWSNSIIPEHKERVLNYAKELKGFQMPEPYIEYAIVRADGKMLWLGVKIFAVVDQIDGSYHICGSVSDITERKAAEQRVSDFYSTVSHELKTPLTSIKGVLLLLERGKAGPLSQEAQALTLLGRHECDRLIRLINDMLDIKRIEVGKLQLLRQWIEPDDVVGQTLNLLSGLAEAKKIRLAQNVEQIDKIYADKDRVVQVLTNFLSNAVKFSTKGSTVEVDVQAVGNSVRFSVTDHGPGIRLKDQHKLFKVFEQVESSDGIKHEGTGLGLAICKGIVDEHGGQIGVVSDEGKGATFWFEVPISGTAE